MATGTRRKQRFHILGTLLFAGTPFLLTACDRRPPNEPPSEVFAFPTGLKAHSYGAAGPNLLFVLNSNFDLNLSGGSLVTVDIDLAEELGTLCAGATGGPCLVRTPQGTPRLKAEAIMHALDAVRVASYARDLAITSDGLELYAPSSGDDSLTWIEVDPADFAKAPMDRRGALTCFGPMSSQAGTVESNADLVNPEGDVGPEDEEDFEVPVCDERHRPNPKLAEIYEDSNPGPLGFDPAPLANLPAAPFGLVLSADDALIHVTHLDTGELSVFHVLADDDGRPEYLASFDSVDFSNGIALHAPTGLVYVTGRSPSGQTTGTRVAVFETAALAVDPAPFLPTPPPEDGAKGPPVESPELSPLLTSVNIASEAGHDIRGIAFSSDGNRGYLVERSGGGDLLLIVDTSGARTGEFDMPPIGVVPVGQDAQNVLVIPGAGSGGGDVVAVTCFGDDTVYLVDDALGEVVRIVEVDDGPFGLALFTPQGAAGPTRLFVSSFSAGTVTALDVQPGPAFGAPLWVIGEPARGGE